MDTKDFIAGRLENRFQYKCFVPEKINHEWEVTDEKLLFLLSEAESSLSELKSAFNKFENKDEFIAKVLETDALSACAIEGINISPGLLRIPDNEISIERYKDVLAVKNYIDAISEAIEMMKRLPISSRLIQEINFMLLDGIRGAEKAPGFYRKSQTWIGGKSLTEATFVPPHQDYLEELLSDYENFLYNEEIKIPFLIRLGIAHYQFETIFPFLEGTGRVNKIITVLLMIENGIIPSFILGLSDFFNKNRMYYFGNMQHVRKENGLNDWLIHFLVAVKESAQRSIRELHTT